MTRLAAALFVPALLASAPGHAGSYPERPLTIVVPYTAGGPMDLVARQYVAALKDKLGTSIVIENQAGAGGMIGSQRVARAAPDGYTVLLQHIGLATLPALYPGKVDPVRDFVAIGMVAEVDMMIAVPAASDIRDARTLMASDAGMRLNWGTAGPGSASSLCVRLLGTKTKDSRSEIGYKGTGPALIDLAAGRLDVMCDLSTNLKPMLDANKLRAIVSMSHRRNAAFPDVPSASESHLGVTDLRVWYGLFAPAGTPREVLQTLRAASVQAVGSAAYRSGMTQAGALVPNPAEAEAANLSRRLADDAARFGPLLAGESVR